MKKAFAVCIFFISFYISNGQKFVPLRSETLVNQYLPKRSELTTPLEPSLKLSSGLLQQTIPIISLDGQSMKVDISLLYAGGGIRVNDIASNVGLGWTLNGGGLITRELRDIPDERKLFDIPPNHQGNSAGWLDSVEREVNTLMMNGIFFPGIATSNKTVGNKVDVFRDFTILGHTGQIPPNYPSSYTPIRWRSFDLPNHLAMWHGGYGYFGKLDTEPDIFHFSFGNYSGKFVFDENSTPVIIPHSNIKVEPAFGQKGIGKWIFTVEDGTKYIFENNASYTETTKITTNNDPWQDIPSRLGDQSITVEDYVSKWHLSKIITTLGEEIVFTYVNSTYTEFTNTHIKLDFKKTFHKTIPIHNIATNLRYNRVSKKEISREKNIDEIVSSRGRVKFNYNIGTRLDFLSRNSLQSVHLFDKNNNRIRYASFVYSHFNAGGTTSDDYRLKLNGISYGGGNNSVEEAVSFEYNTTINLPIKNSPKQDFWGFYNNNTKPDLIPSVHVTQSIIPEFFDGADRDPDETKAQANILTKINWPTGGSTEFKYELNDYFDAGSNSNKKVGGLRIKEIVRRESLYSENVSQLFKYNNPEFLSQSSGVHSPIGELHDITCTPVYSPYTEICAGERDYFVTRYSYPKYMLQVDPVQYSVVTVEEQNKGKTIYNFTTSVDFPDIPTEKVNIKLADDLEPSSFNIFSTYSSRTSPVPVINKIDKSYLRGLLKEERIYNNVGDILLKKKYTYEVSPSIYTPKFIKFLGISSDFDFPGPMDPLFICSWNVEYSGHSVDLVYLKKEEIEEFQGGISLMTKKEYELSPNTYLPYKTTTINSKNESIIEISKTSKDEISGLPLDAQTAKAEMADRNMISQVIEKTNSMTQNGITKQLNLTRINYANFLSNYLPKSVDIQNGTNPIETRQLFNAYDKKGNLLEQQKPGNVKESYQWGYNKQYPVVKIIGAGHNNRTETYNTQYGYRRTTKYINLNTTAGEQRIDFTTDQSGDVKITLPGYLGEDWAATYNFGNNMASGGLLSMRSYSRPSPEVNPWKTYSSNPSYYKLSNTHTSIPAGTYTLRIYPENRYATSSSSSRQLYIEYTERYVANVETIITGENSWFYEGFEDWGTVTGNAFAGERYFTGDYELRDLNLVTGKEYEVNYRYHDAAEGWKSKTVAYSPGMILSDGSAIDEVRVYPKEAQMSTYTYKSGIGMTSEIDPSGRAIFYQYDDFGRLNVIKDEQGKVLKVICYSYAGQVIDCSTTVKNVVIYKNDALSKMFYKNDCRDGATGADPIPFSIEAEAFFSSLSKEDANRQAEEALNRLGQEKANLEGTCVSGVVVELKTAISSATTRVEVWSEDFSFNESYDFPANDMVSSVRVQLPSIIQPYIFKFYSSKQPPSYSYYVNYFYDLQPLDMQWDIRSFGDGIHGGSNRSSYVETLPITFSQNGLYTITVSLSNY